METQQEGNAVVVKLSDGDDLFPSLEAAARKHDIESGTVLWGIGMLQDFEIGYFGPRGKEKPFCADRQAPLAPRGGIARRPAPTPPPPPALGRRAQGAIGGLLSRAKPGVVNETKVAGFDSIVLNRRFNEKTGM